MEFTIETITPADAYRYLEGNTHNRKPRDTMIKKYARDMRLGRWLLTGEGIKFNGDGTLLDGQNRLWACIESGAPFTTLVVRDVETIAQDVMDSGAPRSASDVLLMEGVTHVNQVAGVARFVMNYRAQLLDNPRSFNASTSQTDVLEFCRANIDQLHASIDAGGRAQYGSGLMRRAGATLHYVAVDGGSADAATRFFDGVATGAGLMVGDPRLTLRNWTSTGNGRRIYHNAVDHLHAATKAWNAYVQGRTLRIVRPWERGTDPFPEIIVGR